MSVKTSNTQEVIERMPFHKFTSLNRHLSKYLEAEAKQANGEGNTAEGMKDTFKEQSSSMMNNAKTMMKTGTKMPKIK